MPRFFGARSDAMAIFLLLRMNSSMSEKKFSMLCVLPMMFWMSSMMSTSASWYSRRMMPARFFEMASSLM